MFSVPRPVMGAMQNNHHGHRIRRRKLLDLRLQGGLLVALVLLELAMLIVGMFYLYVQFSAAIEANLFTIHRTARVALLPVFLEEMAKVVVTMGVINTLALLLANHLWVGHIRQVLSAFRARLQRIEALNLRRAGTNEPVRHEVITLLDQWRQREGIRAQQIDALLAQLPGADEPLDADALKQLVSQLDALLQNIR